MILGIGVNVNMPIASLPPSLHATATTLFEHVNDCIDRDELLAQLTHTLDAQYQKFWDGDTADMMHEYLSRSDTIGRHVLAHLPVGAPVEGWADGIESDGSLRLRCSQGNMAVIRSADIVHLR